MTQKVTDLAIALHCLAETHGDYLKALALARKYVAEKTEQQDVVAVIAKLKITGHWIDK